MHLWGAEEMYKGNSQLRIEDFVFPYGRLDPENDWIKLAALVPGTWRRSGVHLICEQRPPGTPAWMALGVLLIQRRLKCSDQLLVEHVSENPYLQFFIEMKECGCARSEHPRWWRFGNGSARRIWRRSWGPPFLKRRRKRIRTMETTRSTAERSSWMPPAVPQGSLVLRMWVCWTKRLKM